MLDIIFLSRYCYCASPSVCYVAKPIHIAKGVLFRLGSIIGNWVDVSSTLSAVVLGRYVLASEPSPNSMG